jgi:arylsulfatase A-like enzyme
VGRQPLPLHLGAPLPPTNTDKDLDVHPWELYNLNDDYSQAHNLADKNPEKLKELLKVFDEEATRNHAYPILAGSLLAARHRS